MFAFQSLRSHHWWHLPHEMLCSNGLWVYCKTKVFNKYIIRWWSRKNWIRKMTWMTCHFPDRDRWHFDSKIVTNIIRTCWKRLQLLVEFDLFFIFFFTFPLCVFGRLHYLLRFWKFTLTLKFKDGGKICKQSKGNNWNL